MSGALPAFAWFLIGAVISLLIHLPLILTIKRLTRYIEELIALQIILSKDEKHDPR